MTNYEGKNMQEKSRGGHSRRIAVVALVATLVAVAIGLRWHGDHTGAAGIDTEHSAQGGSKTLWTCSMHPQVLQDEPGVCPICHMQLSPLNVSEASADEGQCKASKSGPEGCRQPSTKDGAKGRKVKYWWDPMLNPPYISDKPGKSPMGMDLIPVYEDEAPLPSAGAITIDPVMVQNMGVRVATVTESPLRRSIRAVGYLEEAQPNIQEVNLRVSGWIRRLYANTEGMHLEAGAALFDLYSPELQVAVEELITARRAKDALPSDASGISGRSAKMLYDAAVRKLELLGLPRRQMNELAKLDRSPETITFTSPITGHVTEKLVVEGAAVKAGDRVFRIVDHSTLWLDAQVFEQDLPFVALGQKATASIASRPGELVDGTIIFIHPHLENMTRTAMVRLAIPNPSLNLRPAMYATVMITAELASRVVTVPREAVIDTGEEQLAFVALEHGRFEPRKIKMGLSADGGMVQVLEGLAPGEPVVVSGQFLLDSESRLREAIRKFLDAKKQQAPGTPSPAQAMPDMQGMHDEMGNTASAASGGATSAKSAGTRPPEVDPVVATYLKVSAALGAPQKADRPVDLTELVGAAHTLHAAAKGTEHETLAADIAKAAEAMRGQPIDRQRELFKALSAKVIALVEGVLPSRKVAEKLYLVHCPMAEADWLQATGEIANPFFPDTMKQCGQVTKTFDTTGGDQR